MCDALPRCSLYRPISDHSVDRRGSAVTHNTAGRKVSLEGSKRPPVSESSTWHRRTRREMRSFLHNFTGLSTRTSYFLHFFNLLFERCKLWCEIHNFLFHNLVFFQISVSACLSLPHLFFSSFLSLQHCSCMYSRVLIYFFIFIHIYKTSTFLVPSNRCSKQVCAAQDSHLSTLPSTLRT